MAFSQQSLTHNIKQHLSIQTYIFFAFVFTEMFDMDATQKPTLFALSCAASDNDVINFTERPRGGVQVHLTSSLMKPRVDFGIEQESIALTSAPYFAACNNIMASELFLKLYVLATN